MMMEELQPFFLGWVSSWPFVCFPDTHKCLTFNIL
jgi:hypothetical protein